MTAVPMVVAQRDSLRRLEEEFAGAAAHARAVGGPVLVSVSTAVERLDPVTVYAAARERGRDAVFWHVPWQNLVLVGIGAAWTVTAAGRERFQRVSQSWRSVLDGAVHVVDETVGRRGGGQEAAPGPGPMLIGGFAFDAGSATGPWTPFGDARLDLPRVMYGEAGGRAWLTVNTLVTGNTEPAAAARAVVQDRAEAGKADPRPREGAGGRANPEPSPAEDVPSKERWLAAVRETAAAIRGGLLDKVVLARSARLVSPTGFDLEGALRYLQVRYPECYVFAVGRGDDCFLGATPERIVHKNNGRVQVACMAGSIGRGATPEEDERLGRWLLADPKNTEEHRVVLRSILDALAPVCTDVVAAPRTGLRKLANVQHLYTPVTARVKADVDVLALVSRVHPTPAIGGWPTEAALKLIREIEELDRGWYAGPVGWMDGAGDGEFAVGLRSALVRGDTALLFAGCGIMGDSDPESEYEESVLKLRPMRAALGAQR